MLLTKKDIENLRDKAHLNISIEKEITILNHFGTNPDDDHEWSEQDIYEQVRKML